MLTEAICFSGLYGLLLFLMNVVSSDEESGQTFLPQHEFMVEKQKFTKKNEEPKHHVSLIIGAYVFTRNRKAAGIGKNAKFICNGCKKLGSRTGALAKLIAKNDNQNDYQLMSCDLEHACTPPSVAPLKKKFMSKLYEEVKKNPSKAIGRIYSEIRDEFSNNLSPDEKKQFIRIIPSQASCTSNLTAYKNEFIPTQPKDIVSSLNSTYTTTSNYFP